MTSMIGLLGWFGTIWMVGIPAAEAKKRKDSQPCWVTQPCDPYDANAYMIGVGSGFSVTVIMAIPSQVPSCTVTE